MYTYNGKITRVVDGDTYDAMVDLGFGIYKKIRIRLYGIDTPETYRPRNINEKKAGLMAKEFAKSLLLDKDVVIKTHKDDKGKYGRYLADIWIDGVSIVETLREHGFEKKEHY